MVKRGIWLMALLLACFVGEYRAQTETSPQSLSLKGQRVHRHRGRHRGKHTVQQQKNQTNSAAANNSNSTSNSNAGTGPNLNGKRRRRYDPVLQPPEKSAQPGKRPPSENVP